MGATHGITDTEAPLRYRPDPQFCDPGRSVLVAELGTPPVCIPAVDPALGWLFSPRADLVWGGGRVCCAPSAFNLTLVARRAITLKCLPSPRQRGQIATDKGIACGPRSPKAENAAPQKAAFLVVN